MPAGPDSEVNSRISIKRSHEFIKQFKVFALYIRASDSWGKHSILKVSLLFLFRISLEGEEGEEKKGRKKT